MNKIGGLGVIGGWILILEQYAEESITTIPYFKYEFSTEQELDSYLIVKPK